MSGKASGNFTPKFTAQVQDSVLPKPAASASDFKLIYIVWRLEHASTKIEDVFTPEYLEATPANVLVQIDSILRKHACFLTLEAAQKKLVGPFDALFEFRIPKALLKDCNNETAIFNQLKGFWTTEINQIQLGRILLRASTTSFNDAPKSASDPNFCEILPPKPDLEKMSLEAVLHM